MRQESPESVRDIRGIDFVAYGIPDLMILERGGVGEMQQWDKIVAIDLCRYNKAGENVVVSHRTYLYGM